MTTRDDIEHFFREQRPEWFNDDGTFESFLATFRWREIVFNPLTYEMEHVDDDTIDDINNPGICFGGTTFSLNEWEKDKDSILEELTMESNHRFFRKIEIYDDDIIGEMVVLKFLTKYYLSSL